MIGNKIEPFKFWCQKVLPNVYDDSLSYYEYLCKLNKYLDDVITQINTLTEAEENFQEDLTTQWNTYKTTLTGEWNTYKTGLTAEWNAYKNDLTAQWTATKNYIDNYFNNLNVQQEINNKLDALVLDGTISNLLSPIVASDVPSIVTSWLVANVDPVGSAVTVDSSLSISGSAADAKVVGDEFAKTLRSSGYNLYTNHLEGFTSADDFPSNSVISVSNVSQSDIANLPTYANVTQVIVTLNYDETKDYSKVQYSFCSNGFRYARMTTYKATSPYYEWSDWDRGVNAISASNITLYHEHLSGYTSADDLPINSIVSISDIDANEFDDLPVYDVIGILITANCSKQTYGAMQMFVTSTGDTYTRICIYDNTLGYKWLPWYHTTKCPRRETITFSSTGVVNTTLRLEANKKYGIYIPNIDSTLNLFVQNHTDKYVSTSFYDYVEFIPEYSGVLSVYNIGGYTGDAEIIIYEDELKEAIDSYEYVYEVGTGKDYESIVACFQALRRDSFKKKIIVYGGLYDIAEEYEDNNIPVCPDNVDPIGNFIPYNAIVPANTHLVGKGNVILKCFGDASTWTYNQAYAISALNVLGSCIIENITVWAKNCRYCLHDDYLSNAVFNGSKHLYKNVKFIKEIGETGADTRKLGTNACTGFGFNPYTDYEFENCEVINLDNGGTLYGHNRGTVGEANTVYNCANIKAVNSAFKKSESATSCIWLDNQVSGESPSERITTKFINCSINGTILSSDGHDASSGNNPNVYDITLFNSSNVTVTIADANNQYEVTRYAI